MTKILIVGATGLVGSNLVKTCKEQNKEVRALVRTETLANPLKVDLLKDEVQYFLAYPSSTKINNKETGCV